jgi:hypothetical protein
MYQLSSSLRQKKTFSKTIKLSHNVKKVFFTVCDLTARMGKGLKSEERNEEETKHFEGHFDF